MSVLVVISEAIGVLLGMDEGKRPQAAGRTASTDRRMGIPGFIATTFLGVT
jgi:hypothetical protein